MIVCVCRDPKFWTFVSSWVLQTAEKFAHCDRALLSMLPKNQSVAAATRLVRTAVNYTFNYSLLEQTRRDVARSIGARQC
jgi:hypothetical protein